MNDSTVWKFLYYVVLFMHYFGIGLLVFFLIRRLGFFRAWGIWFVVWLGSGIVFNGCIFTYWEQYCALKAGMRAKMSYNLKESFAYKAVLHFFL